MSYRQILFISSAFCWFLLGIAGCRSQPEVPLSLINPEQVDSIEVFSEMNFDPTLTLQGVERQLLEAGSTEDMSFYVESFWLKEFTPAEAEVLLSGQWKDHAAGYSYRTRNLKNGTSPYTEQLVFFQGQKLVMFASFHSPKGVEIKRWLKPLIDFLKSRKNT